MRSNQTPHRTPMIRNLLRKRLLSSAFVYATGLMAALTPSSSLADAWEDAANGQSSFVTKLGPDFSVPVPVKHVPGSRLVLFNFELARKLGLSETDMTALEQRILEHFAVTSVDAEGSGRAFFATRYLDYQRASLERLGSPMGDGRAAWTGELKIPASDGRTIYLDVAIKGLGTPLARKVLYDDNGKPKNLQYADGLQGMDEAVKSFIASNALAANGVSAVQDLAVIELPLEKTDSDTGSKQKAAITIRVGPQTRIGHVWYHSENQVNLRKMIAYVVRRDLGLPEDTIIGEEHLTKFMVQFTRNLAKQSAYYTDLNFVHGSLTSGNQTTRGYPIDFGTFMALDAYHPNMKYLYGQLQVANQTQDLFNYVKNLHAMMKDARYYRNKNLATLNADMEDAYRMLYDARLSWLRLTRLGLGSQEIGATSRELRSDFNKAVDRLALLGGSKVAEFYAGNTVPSAFEVNQIVRHSLRILELPANQQDQAWIDAFVTDKSWGTLNKIDFKELPGILKRLQADSMYREAMNQYVDSVRAIRENLRGKGFDLRKAIERAEEVGANRRSEANFPNTNELMTAIRDGKKNFVELSTQASSFVERLTDHHKNDKSKGRPAGGPLRCRAIFR